MPAKIGTCPTCHKTDVKISNSDECFSCMGKRGAGKKHAFGERNLGGAAAPPAAPVRTEPETKAESTPQPPEKTERREEVVSRGPVEDYYACEGCGVKVEFAQRKCKKCGIWLDWRGTSAETDEDIVICPACGAVCGYSDNDVAKCPHCGHGG